MRCARRQAVRAVPGEGLNVPIYVLVNGRRMTTYGMADDGTAVCRRPCTEFL